MPSVGNTVSLCSGYEKTHTLIVLGGDADVISVGSMWGPTCVDGRVVVHKAFCSKGHDGRLVVIKKGVDFFVGGLGEITARETKEVERELDLRQKFIPELQGAVLVDGGKPRNEVLLECCDGALGGVDPMVVGGDKVNVHVILANVHRDSLGAFIVHYVQCGVIVTGGESGEDVGEGVDHGAIILGGHGAYEDGVEVVNVCHKNVLHRLEGADGGGARKIGIHCTMVRSARAAKQKTSWVVHISSVGISSPTWRRALRMAGWRERVERVPCRWRRM